MHNWDLLRSSRSSLTSTFVRSTFFVLHLLHAKLSRFLFFPPPPPTPPPPLPPRRLLLLLLMGKGLQISRHAWHNLHCKRLTFLIFFSISSEHFQKLYNISFHCILNILYHCDPNPCRAWAGLDFQEISEDNERSSRSKMFHKAKVDQALYLVRPHYHERDGGPRTLTAHVLLAYLTPTMLSGTPHIFYLMSPKLLSVGRVLPGLRLLNCIRLYVAASHGSH